MHRRHRPAAARGGGATGLSADVAVVAGAIDNTAAAVGSGAVGDYAPHLYAGTSSWLAAHVPFKKTDYRQNRAIYRRLNAGRRIGCAHAREPPR